ncbi:Hypothetical protein SMAX5B_016686 [Scophthalmus maximus]|uniref:Uncharacterized protein n=1 Tax=Scophthalmus maximus TaxID=52904 RepID=A0A2U9CLU0_SCOMX|nr:Hypothetical protein SMAX5B_016686 [Scophthalmus maximus]
MEGMEPDHEGGELTTATANQGLSKSRQDVKSELRKTFLDSKNVFRKNIEEEFNIFKTEMQRNEPEMIPLLRTPSASVVRERQTPEDVQRWSLAELQRSCVEALGALDCLRSRRPPKVNEWPLCLPVMN